MCVGTAQYVALLEAVGLIGLLNTAQACRRVYDCSYRQTISMVVLHLNTFA